MEFNATFIVSAVSFIIFTILMNAIFYKPLNKIVSERQKFIDDTNVDAKNKQKKADALIKDKELKLEKTKQDAKKIIVNKTEEVNTKKSELTSVAQEKASQEISAAKAGLNQSVNDTQKILDDEVNNLADEISSKILGTV